MQNQPIRLDHPTHPDFNGEFHPVGLRIGQFEEDGPDPAWGDVIGGIWDRLTRPLPGSA